MNIVTKKDEIQFVNLEKNELDLILAYFKAKKIKVNNIDEMNNIVDMGKPSSSSRRARAPITDAPQELPSDESSVDEDYYSESDDYEDDEEDYEIEDDATVETDVEGNDEPEMGGQEAADEEPVEDDEWKQFEDFKVGDDAYDLTGENGDEHIVKVFKLLKDDDDVVIKDENGTISLKDNETGAEYVIQTGCDSTPCETTKTVEPETEVDFDVEDDTEEESEYEFEFDSETEDDDDMDFGDDDMDDDFSEEDNNDEEDETMKEGKEMVFEIDLGYTDNYQDKDPIKGLSNNEPSKSGKSWHKGVPTGTNKPWAGKGSSKPFEKKVACCEGEELNLDAPVKITCFTGLTLIFSNKLW
jgi:hypothetical protein